MRSVAEGEKKPLQIPSSPNSHNTEGKLTTAASRAGAGQVFFFYFLRLLETFVLLERSDAVKKSDRGFALMQHNYHNVGVLTSES